MAFGLNNLISFGTGGSISDTMRRTKLWHYITNDALGASAGQVGSTGYFNDAANVLQKGDVIIVSADQDGTPAGEIYLVTNIASGVVTVLKFADATGA